MKHNRLESLLESLSLFLSRIQYKIFICHKVLRFYGFFCTENCIVEISKKDELIIFRELISYNKIPTRRHDFDFEVKVVHITFFHDIEVNFCFR